MFFVQKKFLLLFVLQLVLWLTYLFRPLVGADPYFYLSGVCSSNIVSPDIGFYFVLNLLPCNVFIIQLLLFVVWIATLFVCLKIGELFSKEIGWILPYIISLATFFVFEFYKFENNVFGYLFAFIGFYFLFKFYLHKNWFDLKINVTEIKNFLLVLLFFGLAGLFWKGVVFWLVVLPFFSIVFLPFFLVLLIPDFFGFIFGAFSSSHVIYEHSVLLSIVYLFLTMFFLIGLIKTNKKLILSFTILFIMSLFVLKLYVLPILFISIVSLHFFEMIKHKINIEQTIKICSIFLTLFFIINLQTQFPTNTDIELIQNTIKLEQPIENTFGTGYIIRYFGGQEKKYGSHTTPTELKGIVIELKDQNYYEHCLFLEESTHLRSWNCD